MSTSLFSPASCNGLDLRCVGLDDLSKLLEPGVESLLIFVGVGRREVNVEDLCGATELERIGRRVRIKVDVLKGRRTGGKAENSFHEWLVDANRKGPGQSHILSLHLFTMLPVYLLGRHEFVMVLDGVPVNEKIACGGVLLLSPPVKALCARLRQDSLDHLVEDGVEATGRVFYLLVLHEGYCHNLCHLRHDVCRMGLLLTGSKEG